MFDRRRYGKPPLGTPLNLEHPLARGLTAFVPLWEGSGLPSDAVSGSTAAATPTPPAWASGRAGRVLRFDGATQYADLSGVAGLNAPGPMTVAVGGVTGSVNQFQTLLACTGSGLGYLLYTNSAGTLLFQNSNGTNNWITASGLNDGKYHVFAGSVASTGTNGALLYVDGARAAQGTFPNYPGVPVSPARRLGAVSSNTNWLKGDIAWVASWNRALSADEHARLAANPWQLFGPAAVGAVVLAAMPPEFSVVAPAALYADNPSTAVSLLGYATGWDGSTVFSASGLAGASVTSQAVADATHATIHVATGAATGTLTIGDGSRSARLAVLPQSMAATPAAVPAGHPGNIVLTLTGSGTAWAAGTTTFSASGPAGTSIVAQSVASPTSATVTIRTGAAAGTLTIGDGTNATAVSVAAAALSASPGTVVASGTIDLTGTNTVWTQEAASGLFSASGPAGAALSGVAVASDTRATAVLAPATASGAVTLADNSTGATATVAALAIPSGSIHAGGRLLVGPSAASALFGGRPAATLAFRLEVNSTAGITAGVGIKVVTWGTNASGGSALATYLPAAGTLTLAAYGASGTSQTFSATVPIQLGVGYHFLISWGVTPTLYVNGVAYATAGFSGAATFAYQQVRIGGDAGAGVALDHAVSDLCIWSHYAATAADAVALANRTATPLQVGGAGACSAWWPLGGGAAGSAAAIGDAAFADYTAGGSTLSVLVGDTSAATYSAAIGADPPALIAPFVGKSGKLLFFGATSAARAAGAGYPVAPLTAVAGMPAVRVNGAPVQLGPPTWLSSSQNTPFVAYRLLCGSVPSVIIQAGGADFSASPTASASGGGGSRLVLGTPTVALGVTGYTIQDPGSGFGKPPTVTIADAGGGSGASAYAVAWGGGLAKVVVTAGGSGYASPVVTISGGGGSGAAATATVVGGVITAIVVTKRGSGYTPSPLIDVGVPTVGATGPHSAIGADARAEVYGDDAGAQAGQLRAIVPAVGGTLGCGNGYPATAPPTVSVGTGTGCQINLTVGTNGAITGAAIPAIGFTQLTGYNYPATVQLNVADAAGSGAVLTATTATNFQGGYGITAVNVVSGGSGYTAPSVTIAPAGSTARVLPVISSYVASIPVTNPGSGYTSPPTIAVSDATGSGCIAIPVMSGAAPGDVLDYDAPAAWVTPTINGVPLGGVQAVAGGRVDNWSGRFEGASGGLDAFARTPTMLGGANYGAQAAQPDHGYSCGKNWLLQAYGWGVSGPGTLTRDARGNPVSWTSPATTVPNRQFYTPAGSNQLDGMGNAALVGRWTVAYDDPNVNTAAATAAWLASNAGAAITPVSLSGPGAGTTTGVAIPSGNITRSGSTIGSIGISGVNFGTGYQGALVAITGGGGSGAVATAVVSGGTVTAINVVCPGSGYSSTPTVTVYGTAVAGTAVTSAFDVQPPGSQWNPGLSLYVAAPDGVWHVGNPWVVAPDAATGAAAALPIDRSQPYALDENVRAALTGPSGRTPAVLRFMDLNQGYGGASNYTYPFELADPAGNWHGQATITAYFAAARFFNTDPASATYGWSSTKVYGPQSYFPGQDAAFAITGTLTAGSATVTGLSSNALMAGSAVSGAGVPAGTLIRGFSADGSSMTLSQAATASGTVSLTITNPGFVALPASDCGRFLGHDFGSKGWLAVEMRSTVPHGLTTGQNATFYANSVLVPLTYAPPWPTLGWGTANVWVTGPYTIALTAPTGWYPGLPDQSRAQAVDSAAEVDLTKGGTSNGWQFTVTVPATTGNMPYEVSAASVAQLPGCAYWVNIPLGATDDLARSIARKVAANIGPTNPVWLEYSNEIWNFPAPNWYHRGIINLWGYLAAGTTVAGYFVANGEQVDPLDVYASSVVVAAHLFDLFEQEWVAAGLDPSRLRRVTGSWFGAWQASNAHTQIIEAAHRWGIPLDYVALSPYMDTPGDGPLFNAIAPAGSAIGAAGAWPMDAFADLIRHWMAYNSGTQGAWALPAAVCRSLGQPARPLTLTNANATASARLTPTTIASIQVGAGGSGYGGNPTVKLVGGGGTYTSISATVSGTAITAINVVGASGYTSVPAVVIYDPAGSGAAATAVLAPTSVGSILVTGAGGGFLSAPAVALSGGGGSGASATAILSGDSVSGFNLVGGSGYTSPPKVTISGGGGGLPGGTYIAACTYVDGQGRETTIGRSRTNAVSINAGDVPAVEVAAWPAWAAAMNIYLTGGAAGSEVLYTSVPRSQYGTTYQVGDNVPLNLPLPASPGTPPPSTNLAAANTPALPAPVCYEGAVQQPIPSVPFRYWLEHDLFAHPAYRDLVWGWYAMCQLGCQSMPNGGAAAALYFQLFNTVNYPYMWQLALGLKQVAGAGSTNQFATYQGGAPADGHDHNQTNVSPALQGFRDWFDATSGVAPTITATVPASAATRVAIGTTIQVTYSAAMDAATLTLTLSGGIGACTLASYDAGTLTATFRPPAALAAGTSYTATANGSDADGFAMASADQWSFTTQYPAPSASSPSPADGAIGVAVGTTISAAISGTVDAASVAFAVTPQGGSAIAGTTSFAGGMATFTPTSNLTRYTLYTATLAAAAPDGTAMPTLSWSFTSQADAPTVTATTPADAATLVSPTASITATFDEPVAPSSLSLTLSPAAQVAGPSWDPGTRTATWVPRGGGLAYATSYTATVSATEIDGTTMASPYSFAFATHQAPPDGQGVVLSVGYRFTATIDPSAMSVTLTELSAGQSVAGTASYDAAHRLVNFAPTASLAAGKKYLLRIHGAKDGQGRAIPDITYPVVPGPQRATGWLGGLGRATQH